MDKPPRLKLLDGRIGECPGGGRVTGITKWFPLYHFLTNRKSLSIYNQIDPQQGREPQKRRPGTPGAMKASR